jgi:hypothetical protein
MTKRRKVWEPRGESEAVPLPTWLVDWSSCDREAGEITLHRWPIVAKIAWDAWTQVKGAPAFGSCRVVRVSTEEKE